MRDVALTLVLIGLLPVSFKRPYVGALMFALISLANPHRLTWGFAYSLPWAMAYAVVTMAGLVGAPEKQIGDSLRRYAPVLVYLLWMGVTTAFAFERTDAFYRWQQVIKVHVMCVITLALMTDWTRVKQLVWVTVCSVGFFGLKGGIFTLTSGGGDLVWGPLDSAIQDNNHLAVGLVMMVPLIYWLYTDARKRWLKALLAFSALMTAVSVFGSHSRSAFLGIIAMSGFMLLKSRQKFLVGGIAIVAGLAIASFMPQEFWDRMNTIQTYEEDASAMGRINTWIAATRIANERITGAGFEYYSPSVSQRYSPDPNRVHSAHSIYFQAIGEHGWIGFAMFMFIWLVVWLQCRRIIKAAPDTEEGRSQALLARMIQTSLIGFLVGGSFVNIGNWDMNYYVAIMAMGTARVMGLGAPARAPLPARRPAVRTFGQARLPNERLTAAHGRPVHFGRTSHKP